MSFLGDSKVPWSKLTSGTSSSSAPGRPHMSDVHCVKEKRKDKIPKKLEKKLREFDNSSGTSDSDAKDASDWNPMKDDFSSPSFNSYTKGPGASLKPVGGSSTNSFTLFIDKIPISLTRDGLCNLFSRCGKVKRTSIVRNDNVTTTFGFIDYGTLKEADAALQQLNNFDMGNGIKLVVKVSKKNEERRDDRCQTTFNRNNRNFVKEMNNEKGRFKASFNGEREVSKTEPYSADNNHSPREQMEYSSFPSQSIVGKGRGFGTASHNIISSPGKGSKENSDNSISNQSPTSLQNMQHTQNYGSNSEFDVAHSSLPSSLNSSANNSNIEKHLLTPADFSNSCNTSSLQPSTTVNVIDSGKHANAKPVCNYCCQPSTKKCAVCRTSYCSQECQTKDWATHKVVCKQFAKESCSAQPIPNPPVQKEDKPLSQEDTYQELNDLCQLMNQVNVEPSMLSSSHGFTSLQTQVDDRLDTTNSKSSPQSHVSLNPDQSKSVASSVNNSGKGKNMSMSYSDFNAAFGLMSPSAILPVIDVAAEIIPTHFYAFVCTIVSPCRLSVFPIHERSKIEILKFLEFEKMLDDVEPVTSLPDNKQLFGYRCGKKAFQRIEVNSSTMLVSSYDTGEHLGSINLSQLFMLPPELVSIPSLRIRVSLTNTVTPPVKSTATAGKNVLIEKIWGKMVKVKDVRVIMEHVSTPFVIGTLVSIDEKVNYNDLMSDSGYTCTMGKMQNGNNACSVMPRAPFQHVSSHSNRIQFHVPPKLKEFDIYSTVVTSPGLFWAQVFHEHANSLEKLLEDMNSIYHGLNNSDFMPSVGDICAARFSFDGLFYRAEVIRVNNNGLIDVQFVDYGNKETVSFKDLHHLKPCFLSLPKQALCFALSGIQPVMDTWSPEACIYIKDSILQQKVSVTIVGECPEKYFIIVNHPNCQTMTINDEIVEKGFAKKMLEMGGVNRKPLVSPKIGRGSAFNHPMKSPSTNVVQDGSSPNLGRNTATASNKVSARITLPGFKPEVTNSTTSGAEYNQHIRQNNIDYKKHNGSFNKPSVETKSSIKEKQNIPQVLSVDSPIDISTITLPVNSKIQGIVVHVENPELFYVVNASSTQDLVKLSEAMQSFSHSPISSIVNIGDFCIAKCLQDDCYGRANVLKLKPNKALLQFVDYGNRQPVLIKDLCLIDPKFCILPRQAITCSLSGVSRKWSEQDVQFFTGLVNNRSLEVETIKINEKNVHEVKLVLDSTIDVGRALTEQGHTDGPSPVEPTPTVSAPLCDNLKSCALTQHARVVLADVTSLDEFYVHPYNEDITTNIDKVVVSPSDFCHQLLSCTLPKGSLCFAKFKDDGQWYRACIIGSSPNGDYNVHFIDFGNYSSVSKADVGLCPDSLSSLPILAVRCSLHLVSMCDDATSVQLFKTLTVGKLLEATVITGPSETNKTWRISLTDTSGSSDVDIASCLKSNSDSLSGISPRPVSVVSSNGGSSHVRPPVTIPLATLPKQGECARILLTEVISPCDFYAEFLTSFCLQSFIQGVCSELPLAYNDSSKYAHFKASVGAYCCAKFCKDGCWYRCKVMEVSQTAAKLFYVDYGNTDSVPLDNLYHLDPKFASIPAQAVLCSIVGISPAQGTQWSHTSVEYIKSIASNPLFAVVSSVNDNVVNVELYSNEDCSGSISEALIDNGLAVSDKIQMHTIPPFQLPDVSDDCVNVVVSDVTSFSSLYIQVALPEVQRTLAGLQSSLGTYAKSSSLPPNYHPKVNDYCCAHFEEDNCWYRAQITNISGYKIKVVYVDFGNSDVVGISDVCLLTQDLAKYPQVACHVALFNLASVPLSLLPSFKTDTDGKILNMKVVNCKSEPVEIELYDPENPLSINSSLLQIASAGHVQDKNASRQPLLTINPLPVPEKSEFSSVIVHLDSLKSFYLQVTEDGNISNLIQLMENINAYLSSALPLPAPFAIGQLCLAQFSGDYYRGKILEVSGERSRVYFLDFGNVDVVHSSNMKIIPAELLTLPAQALKCLLKGASSDSVDNPETLKKFSSLGNNNEIKCHVVNRHPLIVDLQKNDSSPTICQSLSKEGSVPLALNCPFDLKQVVIPSFEVLVVVTEIEKPNIIWMQLFDRDALTEFEKVTVEMNNCCNSSMPMEKPLLLGQLCCAKFKVDGSWYRGRVVDFAENGDSMIQFVDFGNIQETSASLVREIPQTLLNLPSQGVPCLLNDFVDDNAKLPGLVMNKQFKCIKKSVAACGLPLVDLYDVNSGSLLISP